MLNNLIKECQSKLLNIIEAGNIKFIHCDKDTFNKHFRNLFLDYGKKIFEYYWNNFNFDSDFPQKETYESILKINKIMGDMYFIKIILPTLTLNIINKIIISPDKNLYQFSDNSNELLNLSLLLESDLRDCYDYIINTDDSNSVTKIFKNTKIVESFNELCEIRSHANELLLTISKAYYYKIHILNPHINEFVLAPDLLG